MSSKIDGIDGFLHQRKKSIAIKEAESTKGEKVNQTEDSKDTEKEENADMVWDQHPAKSWETDNKDLQFRLFEASVNACTKATHNQCYGALVKHADKQSRFLTTPTFDKWVNGNATKKLDKTNRTIIESHVAAHVLQGAGRFWIFFVQNISI